jgi:ABC-2 type transport system permease protein
MSGELKVMPESPRQVAPVRGSAIRTFLWSLRRELWENRSIYLAPLAAAGVVLLGAGITAFRLPERRRAVLLLDTARQRLHIQMPYDIVVSMMLITMLLVWVFYSLDALYGERRDRTLLFWKSLPVSDLTTVLAKAGVLLVVLPLVVLVVTVATQAVQLLISNAVLLLHGMSPATSSQLPIVAYWRTLLYGFVVMTLWGAPLYTWFLLVSAWARRAPLLWAVAPLVSLSVLEQMVFQTNYVGAFLTYRGIGWVTEAFAYKPHGFRLFDPLIPFTPERFLRSPHLWLGLVAAAVFIAAAARLRRHRAPL